MDISITGVFAGAPSDWNRCSYGHAVTSLLEVLGGVTYLLDSIVGARR